MFPRVPLGEDQKSVRKKKVILHVTLTFLPSDQLLPARPYLHHTRPAQTSLSPLTPSVLQPHHRGSMHASPSNGNNAGRYLPHQSSRFLFLIDDTCRLLLSHLLDTWALLCASVLWDCSIAR